MSELTSWDPREIEGLRKLKARVDSGELSESGETTPIGDVVDMDPRELPRRKICRMPGCGKPSRDEECPECYQIMRETDDYERGFDPVT
jgi:hypothetical protein